MGLKNLKTLYSNSVPCQLVNLNNLENTGKLTFPEENSGNLKTLRKSYKDLKLRRKNFLL